MVKACTWNKIKDCEIEHSIWENIDPIIIEHFPWDENGYKPRTEVRFFYTETRLHLFFRAYETEIRAMCYNMNDPVCTDSCVEFFVNPDPEQDERYLNFEINPIGTLHLGIGKDRYSRSLIDNISPGVFQIHSSVDKESINEYQAEYWSIYFSIPYTFIEEYYGKQNFSSGKKMKGNFYKCGDETQYPHFGCWSRVDNPTPDFHRPEYFGDLILG